MEKIDTGKKKSPNRFKVMFEKIQAITSWRRAWKPTPVFLHGEPHGQRSLVDCSSWGRKKLDTTEATLHSGTLIQYDLILNLITSAKTLFPSKVIFTGSRHKFFPWHAGGYKGVCHFGSLIYSAAASLSCGPWDLPREGNGTPLQYFCLENPMDGGAW